MLGIAADPGNRCVGLPCLEVKNNACPLPGLCSGIPRCLAPIRFMENLFAGREYYCKVYTIGVVVLVVSITSF